MYCELCTCICCLGCFILTLALLVDWPLPPFSSPPLLYPPPQLKSLMIPQFIVCISQLKSVCFKEFYGWLRFDYISDWRLSENTQLRPVYLYVLVHAGQRGSPGRSSGETLTDQETAYRTGTREGLQRQNSSGEAESSRQQEAVTNQCDWAGNHRQASITRVILHLRILQYEWQYWSWILCYWIYLWMLVIWNFKAVQNMW